MALAAQVVAQRPSPVEAGEQLGQKLPRVQQRRVLRLKCFGCI